MQSRCLVLFCWLVGFVETPLPTGLCMKAFLFQFNSFSATWIPIYLPDLPLLSDYIIFSTRNNVKGKHCFAVFTCKFSVFKDKGGANRRPAPCVSAFGFYFCFFFFSVTAVPITAPPLIKSNAIHNIKLLLSPVCGRFSFFGSFAVTVSAFLISLVPSLSL